MVRASAQSGHCYAGLKQAAQVFVIDNGPVGRSVGRTMTLAELFVSIKY